MISFELKGDSKIVETGIFLPNIIGYVNVAGFFKKLKLKVYVNDKRSRKKFTIKDNCIELTRSIFYLPFLWLINLLKLPVKKNNIVIYYTYKVKNEKPN